MKLFCPKCLKAWKTEGSGAYSNKPCQKENHPAFELPFETYVPHRSVNAREWVDFAHIHFRKHIWVYNQILKSIEYKKKHPQKKIDHEKVRSLFEAGYTNKEVAYYVGGSVKYISELKNRYFGEDKQ